MTAEHHRVELRSLFSCFYRQYKYMYISVNVRQISCPLSTYNTIIIATTSHILSIFYNCERERNYNDENVILFKILFCLYYIGSKAF